MHQVPLRQNGPWKCCVMGPTFLDPPLSYFLERGLSISISYLPTRLSLWLSYYFWVVQRKKTHVLESAKNVRVTSHFCSHRVDIPQGQLVSSPRVAPSTSQCPPSLAHLSLHRLHQRGWCREINRCRRISRHSPERDPTGGAGTGHECVWFRVNGNCGACPEDRR